MSSEERELQTIQHLQVSGAGGLSNTDRIPYLLSLAKDHPKGEKVTTIKDGSTDLIKFKEALALVKNEKQVLIFVDYGLKENILKAIAAKLPSNSYTEHNVIKHDNDGAAAWVEHHMTRQEDDPANENFKFLIGNWSTAMGYEVPALIFVTKDLTRNSMAAYVQRAKAKLVMYEVPNFGVHITNLGIKTNNVHTGFSN